MQMRQSVVVFDLWASGYSFSRRITLGNKSRPQASWCVERRVISRVLSFHIFRNCTVRVFLSLRFARPGLFWQCFAELHCSGALCAVLCGTAQFGMSSRVVCFLAHSRRTLVGLDGDFSVRKTSYFGGGEIASQRGFPRGAPPRPPAGGAAVCRVCLFCCPARF